MTNIVLVCAVYESVERMRSLVTSLRKADMIDQIQCIFVNTGEVKPYFFNSIRVLPNARLVQVEPKRRRYDEIMREKIAAVSGYCDRDTIIVNTDDDYIFGKFAFPWIRKVYDENKKIKYLSMLRTPLPDMEFKEVRLSGFIFYKVGSMMGGSICVRAYDFLDHLDEYWSDPVSDPMFDRGYFSFLSNKMNDEHPVFMPKDFSVAQHVNFGSNYMEMKSGWDDFMAGIGFVEDENILGDGKRVRE